MTLVDAEVPSEGEIHRYIWPPAGVGQLLAGVFESSVMLLPEIMLPVTLFTVFKIAASVRQPLGDTLDVKVVPLQVPTVEEKGLSEDEALADA